MGRLHLTRLQLTDFRNWADLKLNCEDRHVVLTGENGAGKTNILEAISFLSPGRGLRRATHQAIARSNGPGTWSIYAKLHGFRGEVGIGTGYQENPAGEAQRRIRIDGETARNSEVLLEHARITWLVPAMDSLFTGPASERRRFLDRLVLAIDPGHGRRVADYERSMRARNRLLADRQPDPSWLNAIEAQMAEAGIAIAVARLELLSLLGEAIQSTANLNSAFPNADLALSGDSTGLSGQASSDMEAAFCETLRDQRRADAVAGRTLVGPHRVELDVTHAGKQMDAARCSTGEQKALLTGIVLAHSKLVSDMAGSAPILLLDEIAAHLDSYRRAALFDRIDALDCQAWMTGTDRAMFDSLGDRGTYWRVAENMVAME